MDILKGFVAGAIPAILGISVLEHPFKVVGLIICFIIIGIEDEP